MDELAAAQFAKLRAVRPIAERADAAIWLMEGAAGAQFARKTMSVPLFAVRSRGLFMQRLHVLAHLHHPHLASVPAGRVQKRRECLVYTEYAPRGSLYDAVAAPGKRLWALPLPPLDALRLTQEIAEGMQALHSAGLIHGGLKLGNVLLVADADGQWRAKVTDALLHEGFAGGALRGGSARPTDLADPWLFLAPEQYAGRPELASDQYALAVLAFVLLTGETPYTLDAVAHLQARDVPPYQKASVANPILPLGVDAVLWRGLSRAPKARYPSVRAFAAALAGVLGDRDAPRAVSIAPSSIPILRAAVPPPPVAQLHEEMHMPQPLAVRTETGSLPVPGLPDLPANYSWVPDVVSAYRAPDAPVISAKTMTRRSAVPAGVIIAVTTLLLLLALLLAVMLLHH